MTEAMRVGTIVTGIGDSRSALSMALYECINRLEWQARDAGLRLAHSSVEISTEIRQIEMRTLTSSSADIQYNRVLSATGFAVPLRSDTPEQEVAQPTG